MFGRLLSIVALGLMLSHPATADRLVDGVLLPPDAALATAPPDDCRATAMERRLGRGVGRQGTFFEFSGATNPGRMVFLDPELWSGPVGKYLDAPAQAQAH